MHSLLRLWLVALAGLGLALGLSAQTVRVLTVTGEASIQGPSDPAPRAVAVGDTVVIGTRIVTAANGRVVITPFPGIKSIIAPGTDIVIEKVSETKAAGSQVALQQAVLNLKSGSVVSDLEKQEGVAYDYSIRTPRGVAGARGTTYTVAVLPTGVESVLVSDGRIEIKLASGATFTLVPGQASVIRTGVEQATVSNITELPAAEQQLLQQTMENTLVAVAEAIEQGVDLKPGALRQTLETARELGIQLDQQLLDSLKPAVDREQRRRPGDGPREGGPGAEGPGGEGDGEGGPRPPPTPPGDRPREEVREIIQNSGPNADALLAAYVGLLANDEARAAFEALPLLERQKRVFYFSQLPEDLRGVFVNAPLPRQDVLLGRRGNFDLALARFALAQPPPPLAEVNYFAALPAAVRPAFASPNLDGTLKSFLLARPDDVDLGTFALGTPAPNFNQVTYFSGLSPALRPGYIAASTSVRNFMLTANLDPELQQFAFGGTTPRPLAEVQYFATLASALRPQFLVANASVKAVLLDAPSDLGLAQFALTAPLPSLATVNYFVPLSNTQRGAFLALAGPEQQLLVANAADADLRTYALNGPARGAAEITYFANLATSLRAAFLAAPANIQSLLVSRPGDTVLAQFALTAPAPSLAAVNYFAPLTAPQRTAFLALAAPERQLLVTNSADTDLLAFALNGPARSAAELNYYAALSAALRPGFAAAPADVKAVLLAAPGDAALATFALTAPAPSLQTVNFFAGLTPLRRTSFAALAGPEQQLLVVNATDLDLVSFALDGPARSPAELSYFSGLANALRPAFLAADTSVQALLVANPGDLALASFALGNPAPPLAEVSYFANLAPNLRTAFTTVAADIKQVLLDNPADVVLAAFVLSEPTRTLAESLYFAGLADEFRVRFANETADVRQFLIDNNEVPDLVQFALTGPDRGVAELTYFIALDSAQRTAYLALPTPDQVARAAYYVALDVNQQGAFLAAAPAVQALLVQFGTDTGLAAYALTPPAGDPAPPTAAELQFFVQLATPLRSAYVARPSDVRQLVAGLGDLDYAQLALSPDRTTGVVYTDNDLRDALNALRSLSPAALAFQKEISGGAGLPSIEGAPFPLDYSPAAFDRMAASWNALSTAQKQTIITLNAGESVMDTSASYLVALLGRYNAQPAEVRALAAGTGWGRFLSEIAGSQELQDAIGFTLGQSLTAAQITAIKTFRISPYAINQFNPLNNPEAPPLPVDRLQALATLTTAQRDVFLRLGVQDSFLFDLGFVFDPQSQQSVARTFPQAINDTLAFYNQLTVTQRDQLVALGGGRLIFTVGPNENVGQTTALQTLTTLLADMASLSAARAEAARDLRVLEAIQSLYDGPFNVINLTPALDIYLNAAPGIQTFLRQEFGGNAVIQATIGGGPEQTGPRPLADIVSLLSALTAGELKSLVDMGIRDALLDPQFFEIEFAAPGALPAAQRLKQMIASYDTLSADQKRTLRELGIIGGSSNTTSRIGGFSNSNFAAFLADPEGLAHLLQAYAALSGDLRAGTRRIPPFTFESNPVYDRSRSYFAPATAADYESSFASYFNVSFVSDDDLYVGATRRLRIAGDAGAINDVFVTPAGKTTYLRAADLVDLDNVRLAPAGRLVVESATINVANTNIPTSARIAFNTKFGGTVDGTDTGSGIYPVLNPQSPAFGRVNFQNVQIGGNAINTTADFDTHGVPVIRIGTLANPQLPPP